MSRWSAASPTQLASGSFGPPTFPLIAGRGPYRDPIPASSDGASVISLSRIRIRPSGWGKDDYCRVRSGWLKGCPQGTPASVLGMGVQHQPLVLPERIVAGDVSGWLRDAMAERRLSARVVGMRTGINHSTITRLLGDDGRQPSLATIVALLRLFGAQQRSEVIAGGPPANGHGPMNGHSPTNGHSSTNGHNADASVP